MMHIAICDDKKDFTAHLRKLLNRYAVEAGEDVKVTVYYDGMELIEKYDTTFDLIFLDIQMRLVDGLRTAEHIRRMDEKVGIIFLTTLTQYSLEGYEYQAANYIVKPMQYVRLKAELEQWLKQHRKDDSTYLEISNDSGTYKVFLKSLALCRNLQPESAASYRAGRSWSRNCGTRALPAATPAIWSTCSMSRVHESWRLP